MNEERARNFFWFLIFCKVMGEKEKCAIHSTPDFPKSMKSPNSTRHTLLIGRYKVPCTDHFSEQGFTKVLRKELLNLGHLFPIRTFGDRMTNFRVLRVTTLFSRIVLFFSHVDMYKFSWKCMFRQKCIKQFHGACVCALDMHVEKKGVCVCMAVHHGVANALCSRHACRPLFDLTP